MIETEGSMSLLSQFQIMGLNFTDPVLAVDPLETFYGTQSQQLPFPPGTSANLTLPNYSLPTGPSDSLTFADFEGITSGLECQGLDLPNQTDPTGLPWISINAPVFKVNITDPECEILGVPMGMGTDHNPPHTDTSSQYQGWWGRYTCNNRLTDQARPPTERVEVDDGLESRIVFITSLVQWTPDDGPKIRRVTWVEKFTAITCKASHSIDDYTFTLAQQSQNQTSFTAVKRPESSGIHKMADFVDRALGIVLEGAAKQSKLIDQADRGVVESVNNKSGYLRKSDQLYIVLAGMTNKSGDSAYEALMDQDILLDLAPKAFSGVMGQIFHDVFAAPFDRTVFTQVQTRENRLVLEQTPVALIITLLILLILTTIGTLWCRPARVVPFNPQSIIANARLLAANPELSSELLQVNGQSLPMVKAKLRNREYQSSLDPCFAIHSSHCTNSQEKKAQSQTWWRPITGKNWFILLVVLTPLAVIALLEGMQHVSNTHNGIVDFESASKKSILITLIPAAVMSATTLIIGALNFNTALIAPFQALKKGGVSSSRGMNDYLVGKPPPHVLYLAIKQRFLLPFVSVMAVIVGGFLTIVVSGLYFVRNVPLTQQIEMLETDGFNFTIQPLGISDNLAAVKTSLIFYQNLTYPQWTYEDLVFPTFKPVTQTDQAGSVSFKSTAFRSSLDCLVVDPENVSHESEVEIENPYESKSDQGANSQYKATKDLACLVDDKVESCNYTWSFSIGLPAQEKDFVVGYSEPLLASESDISCTAPLKSDANSTDEFPLLEGCPTVQVAYGRTSTRRTGNDTFSQFKTSIYALLCYQRVESVSTNLTLTLPSLSIPVSTPPTIDSSTAQGLNFTYGNYTGPSYQNSIQTLIDALPFSTRKVDALLNLTLTHDGPVDPMAFTGRAGPNKLKRALNSVYGKYMSQAASTNFRVPIERPKIPASKITPHRGRLHQDENVKIVLQVILAVITACVVVVIIGSGRDIRLPCSPASTAGGMVLLAGGGAVEILGRKGRDKYGKDKRTELEGEGYLFSLGWWNSKQDGMKKRFGIDVGRADAELDPNEGD